MPAWTRGSESSVQTTLLKEMAASRLGAAYSGGEPEQQVDEDLDYRSMAMNLRSALHISLTRNSLIDRLGRRDELTALYPEAILHELPGSNRVPGWWEYPDAYAALIRSVVSADT
ncbi:hypothetical protein GCM10029992_04270 [Glycomyces albus]